MSAQNKNSALKLKPVVSVADVSKKLQKLAASATSRHHFLDIAMEAIARDFGAIWGMLEAQIAGRTITREFSQSELDTLSLAEFACTLSEEAQMDTVSRARVIPSPNGNFVAISCPLMDLLTGAATGTMTFFLSIQDKEDARRQLARIEQVVSHVSQQYHDTFVAPQQTQAAKESPAKLRALLNTAKYDNIDALCFALTNSYCGKLACQRTALGIISNNRVRIAAVSGLDTLVPNSPAIVGIRQAQEECLDFGKRVVVQQRADDDNQTARLLIHQQWLRESQSGTVASIPIEVDGETVAVFSLERDDALPLKPEELETIDSTIQSFGPAIQLMNRSSRPLLSHFKDSCHNKLVKPFKSKLVLASTLLLLGIFIFGWLPYRPTISCSVQPTQINHLVAPYDAVLKEANLYAGDEVTAGQSLLSLDTTEFELQRDALMATIKSKGIQRNDAIAQRDKILAAVVNAEIDALQVELNSVKRKVAQGQLIASNDGLIIRGDLRHQIGQTIPQGTMLLEVAPADGMKIQLEIPESKASLIKVGHEGYFAAETHPADNYKFKITKITPSARVMDGKNVIVAEAEVEGDSKWMRSGMRGYASVRTGWQPVWWIFGHKIIDSLRLGFWL